MMEKKLECPHCGKGDIEYGAKACSECGSKILYKATSELNSMLSMVLGIVFAILAAMINFGLIRGLLSKSEQLVRICCEGVLICLTIYCIVSYIVRYHKNFEWQ